MSFREERVKHLEHGLCMPVPRGTHGYLEPPTSDGGGNGSSPKLNIHGESKRRIELPRIWKRTGAMHSEDVARLAGDDGE